jgi:hypothetical protein
MARAINPKPPKGSSVVLSQSDIDSSIDINFWRDPTARFRGETEFGILACRHPKPTRKFDLSGNAGLTYNRRPREALMRMILHSALLSAMVFDSYPKGPRDPYKEMQTKAEKQAIEKNYKELKEAARELADLSMQIPTVVAL